MKLPACSPQGVLHLYMNVHTKVYTFLHVAYGHWGEFLVDIKMHLFCYQKDRTRFRSVTVHSDLSYDASRAHRRGRGDKTKN